jgi:hypothetical protein
VLSFHSGTQFARRAPDLDTEAPDESHCEACDVSSCLALERGADRAAMVTLQGRFDLEPLTRPGDLVLMEWQEAELASSPAEITEGERQDWTTRHPGFWHVVEEKDRFEQMQRVMAGEIPDTSVNHLRPSDDPTENLSSLEPSSEVAHRRASDLRAGVHSAGWHR